MREVLGAGRGVQAGEVETPAMAAEAGRETRRGAEGDEESDGCDGAQDSERVIFCVCVRICVNFNHLFSIHLCIIKNLIGRRCTKQLCPKSPWVYSPSFAY